MRSQLVFLSMCVALSAACERNPLRGGEGESCPRRDDCADGLSCLGQVCTAEAATRVWELGREAGNE